MTEKDKHTIATPPPLICGVHAHENGVSAAVLNLLYACVFPSLRRIKLFNNAVFMINKLYDMQKLSVYLSQKLII